MTTTPRQPRPASFTVTFIPVGTPEERAVAMAKAIRILADSLTKEPKEAKA